MNDEIKQEEILEEVELEAVPLEEVLEEEESLPETVEVGGKIYHLKKEGAAQAKQVADLLNWLGNYGTQLSSVLSSDGEGAAENMLESTWGMLTAIGKVASEKALLDLFVVVIGCSNSEASKYFSINSLVDGIQVLFAQEEYVKVLNRFF